MKGTVLVCLEMAESADVVLSVVEDLARAGIEKVALLHVLSVRGTLADPAILRYDEAKMAEWRELLLACGVQAVTTEAVDGFPAYEILERSKDPDVSLVVMGSRGGAPGSPDSSSAVSLKRCCTPFKKPAHRAPPDPRVPGSASLPALG